MIEGRSGVGRLGKKYCYYVCRAGRGMRIPADRLEGAVLDRLRLLASDPTLVESLVTETNRRRHKELPKLREQREALTKQLIQVAADADQVLGDWSSLAMVRTFVEDRLSGLSQRREDLRNGVADLDRQIAEIEASVADAEQVRLALSRVDEVYA